MEKFGQWWNRFWYRGQHHRNAFWSASNFRWA